MFLLRFYPAENVVALDGLGEFPGIRRKGGGINVLLSAFNAGFFCNCGNGDGVVAGKNLDLNIFLRKIFEGIHSVSFNYVGNDDYSHRLYSAHRVSCRGNVSGVTKKEDTVAFL